MPLQSPDGSFSVTAGVGDVIIFSSVGFATQEIKVTDENPITVKLADDKKEMNEVVVTALGSKKQARSVGYSTTQGRWIQTDRSQNPESGRWAHRPGKRRKRCRGFHRSLRQQPGF